MKYSNELTDILACPKCKGPVKVSEENGGFVCPVCKLLYKDEDNIPNFLIEEAIMLED